MTAVLALIRIFSLPISPCPSSMASRRQEVFKRHNSRVKIIFLTIHEDRDFIAAAFSAGATGYVTKRRLSTDLVFAIQEAMKGHTFVSIRYEAKRQLPHRR